MWPDLAGGLIYTAVDPILTLVRAYEARMLVSRRQGGDVGVAFRLDLGENGTPAMRATPTPPSDQLFRPDGE